MEAIISRGKEKRLFQLAGGSWLQTSQHGGKVEARGFTPPFSTREYHLPNEDLSRVLIDAKEVIIPRRNARRPLADLAAGRLSQTTIAQEEAGLAILSLLVETSKARRYDAPLAPKVIPQTCLRRFYDFLTFFPNDALHRSMARFTAASPDGAGALETLFDEAVRRCSGYDNPEPFYPHRSNPWRLKTLAQAEADPRVAVALVPLIGNLMTTQNYFSVSAPDGLNLDFAAASYEVNPLRTRRASYEPGISDQFAGQGRIDLLLRSEEGGLPIIGEAKAPNDSNLYVALVQALTYAAELTTPHQFQRLRCFDEFQKPGSGEVRCDIYLLYFQVDPPELQETLEIAKRLLEQTSGAVAKHVRRLAFLEVSLPGGQQIEFKCCHALSSDERV